MNKNSNVKGFLNFWVISIAVIITALLSGFIILILYYFHPVREMSQSSLQPVFTIIPAKTLTPVVTMPAVITPSVTPVPPGEIGIGVYVRVSGTNGQGLRLRAKPGISNPMLFLGMDSEVFQVKDGPQKADNFTWWYLQAPYDKNRSGWAVQDYLTLLKNP